MYRGASALVKRSEPHTMIGMGISDSAAIDGDRRKKTTPTPTTLVKVWMI